VEIENIDVVGEDDDDKEEEEKENLYCKYCGEIHKNHICTNNKIIIHSTVTPIQLLLSKLNKEGIRDRYGQSQRNPRSRRYIELKKIISTFCYSEMEDYSTLSSILNINNTSIDTYFSSSSSLSSFSSTSSSSISDNATQLKDNFRYFIPYDILEVYTFIKNTTKDINIQLPSVSKDNKEVQLIFALVNICNNKN